METDLSSFHFAHNPNCDCGIVEAYAKKRLAVQASHLYHERYCLRPRKKARRYKIHFPYETKRQKRQRKVHSHMERLEKSPSTALNHQYSNKIDSLKYDPRAESVNGQISCLELCHAFKSAGKFFASELDGLRIFRAELEAVQNGEYTGVLDPRLWRTRLYQIRDAMGTHGGVLLDNVSMAEMPTSTRCSKQFRATRASSIYIWWRICKLIEDFCTGCAERKKEGKGLEYEHQAFVEEVLKMKELIAYLWYALGIVLWLDMQKSEGFRWNIIYVHLNGQSTRLPSLNEYAISKEVFSTIPDTDHLPCLAFDAPKNIHRKRYHSDTTFEILTKILTINEEVPCILKSPTSCYADFQGIALGFIGATEGPYGISMMESEKWCSPTPLSCSTAPELNSESDRTSAPGNLWHISTPTMTSIETPTETEFSYIGERVKSAGSHEEMRFQKENDTDLSEFNPGLESKVPPSKESYMDEIISDSYSTALTAMAMFRRSTFKRQFDERHSKTLLSKARKALKNLDVYEVLRSRYERWGRDSNDESESSEWSTEGTESTERTQSDDDGEDKPLLRSQAEINKKEHLQGGFGHWS